jgi:uncharacterized DUF497 family protein
MVVTFDRAKNAANKTHHGISLARAADLDLTTARFVQDTRLDYGEERWIAVGFIDARLYVLVYTMRGEESIHAISLRKANKRECKEYAEG